MEKPIIGVRHEETFSRGTKTVVERSSFAVAAPEGVVIERFVFPRAATEQCGFFSVVNNNFSKVFCFYPIIWFYFFYFFIFLLL